MADTRSNETYTETTDVHQRPWRRIALALGSGLLAITLLAFVVGSNGGGSDLESSAPDMDSGGDSVVTRGASALREVPAEEATDGAQDLAYSSDSTTDEAAGGAEPAVDIPLDDRAVIRTGSLSLTSADVAAARREVLNVVTGLGGYVADEQSRADDEGELRLTDLTVQVPTDELDTAMERFSDAGTVTGRTQSARDVTEQVVDVDTRVDNAEASLRRIRLLLGRAVNLGDVIRLEQVLSSRQADLESLLAQQQSLAAKTDLGTIQVTIEVPPKDPPVVEADAEEATGFFAGLSRGWDALAAGYVTLATAFGTALPTLIVLGALALLARLVVRRFRRRPVSASAVA